MRKTRMSAGAAVAALSLAATPAAAQCDIQTRPIAIELEQVGPGISQLSIPIDPPVTALNGTAFLVGGADLVVHKDPEGQARAFASVELLDDGAVVGGSLGTAQVTLTATRLGIILRMASRVTAPAATVDEIRLTLEVRLLSGSPATRATLTGLSGQPETPLHIVPNLLSTIGSGRMAHTQVRFDSQPALRLSTPGAGPWEQIALPEPVSLDGAAVIAFGSWGFSTLGGPNSGMVETRLELDDGSELVLDDAYSPSAGHPRPAAEQTVAVLCASRIDDVGRATLAGRSVVGIRYRGHLAGSGSITLNPNPPGSLELLVARCRSAWPCYADADANGELDFFDFLAFQNEFAAGAPAADCDGNGVLDFFDFLCFQNAFAAGCP